MSPRSSCLKASMFSGASVSKAAVDEVLVNVKSDIATEITNRTVAVSTIERRTSALESRKEIKPMSITVVDGGSLPVTPDFPRPSKSVFTNDGTGPLAGSTSWNNNAPIAVDISQTGNPTDEFLISVGFSEAVSFADIVFTVGNKSRTYSTTGLAAGELDIVEFNSSPWRGATLRVVGPFTGQIAFPRRIAYIGPVIKRNTEDGYSVGGKQLALLSDVQKNINASTSYIYRSITPPDTVDVPAHNLKLNQVLWVSTTDNDSASWYRLIVSNSNGKSVYFNGVLQTFFIQPGQLEVRGARIAIFQTFDDPASASGATHIMDFSIPDLTTYALKSSLTALQAQVDGIPATSSLVIGYPLTGLNNPNTAPAYDPGNVTTTNDICQIPNDAATFAMWDANYRGKARLPPATGRQGQSLGAYNAASYAYTLLAEHSNMAQSVSLSAGRSLIFVSDGERWIYQPPSDTTNLFNLITALTTRVTTLESRLTAANIP